MPLLREFYQFLNVLFTPANLALVSTVGGIGYKLVKRFVKKLDEQHDAMLEALDVRIQLLDQNNTESHRKIELEILRLQILNGVDSHRFSSSEVLYFFDKYKALGGNSFVEEKVQAYIYDLQNGRDSDETNSGHCDDSGSITSNRS